MLKREIGKWDLVLFMINSLIGAGIFGLPSKIFALSAWYSIPALFITAGIVLILVLNFAEVGSRYTKTGGPYLYTLKAFGRFPAFLMGWLLLITRLATYAALVNILPSYLSFFYPELGQIGGKTAIIFFITLFFTVINYRGVRNSTRWNNGLAIGKLIPLLVFIIVGLFFIQPENIQIPKELPEISGFSQSIFLLIFAFTGFEAIIVSTGEIKNPRKNIPFGLIISLFVVSLFYGLIQFVSIGTLTNLAQSEKPLVDAAYLFMGNGGAIFITIGALISVSGTLNTVMFIGGRIPFALADEKQLPSFFAKIHAKFSTPTRSLILFASLAFLVSVSGTFIYALTISVISKVMIFLIVSAALLRLRFKEKDQKDFFKLRFGKISAWTGIILSIILLSTSKIEEFRDVALTLLFGVFVWLLNLLWIRKKKEK
ncbi:MAG: APC family permease [Bacteroidales bacterium]|jgi:APA family basic amino acid/polyamine antiporter|nr:APC family permease [Bacteroidales bacterium]